MPGKAHPRFPLLDSTYSYSLVVVLLFVLLLFALLVTATLGSSCPRMNLLSYFRSELTSVTDVEYRSSPDPRTRVQHRVGPH